MKRAFCFLIVFLFIPHVALSAPCYGTKMPEKKQFYFGAQSYYVFEKDLKNSYGDMRSLQQFVQISYGIFDWLSLDLKGGCGYIKQHPVGADEIDYPTFMGGGYGFRIRLYKAERFKTVFGFQHISIHPYSIEINNVKHKAVLDDWQFSLLGSYEFSKVAPYAGIRVSRMDYIHWQDDVRKRYNSDNKNIGLIIGLDLPLKENVWLNIEGSAFDSTAFAGSINFHF